MKTYPIMLDVRGRLCVVVGAGAVGLRKVAALRRAGAKVRLVDRQAAWRSEDGQVEVVAGEYEPRLVEGAALVFACTDERAVNARVAADARAAGALVNAADQPEDCDFFAAATFTDGDVVVAVGTGGSAPALAAELAGAIAAHVPPRVGAFAEALGQARLRVLARAADQRLRRKVLRRLAGPEGHRAFMTAGLDGLLKMIDAELPQT